METANAANRVPGPVQKLEHRQFLGLFLNELSAEERDVAKSYYQDELSMEQIAQKTGCSRRAVSRKLSKIQDRARRFTEAHDVA